MRAPKLTAVAAAAVLLAGCRGVETPDRYAAPAREGMGPAPTGTAASTGTASTGTVAGAGAGAQLTGNAAEAPFGPACASLPTGSPAVAQAPVATAVGNSPQLSTLAAALKKAGLTGPLNAAKDITVFAPTNATFAKGRAADRDTLAYHVVPERLDPANLAGRHRTMRGAFIDVVGNGTDFLVDARARVVCGNVRTANATVYVIDAVLTPAA